MTDSPDDTVLNPAGLNPSGIPLKPFYEDGDATTPPPPGKYPYTRGLRPAGYRTRTWTMRQYAGFGTAEETNERFKLLLAGGQTGLSVAFDLPTQIGYAADDPMAAGEVGRVGVHIDTLADMEALFRGIPLNKVTTSMTINATAALLLLLYQLVGEKQGVTPARLGGTIQNDILKEYIARGTYIFPPRHSMRLVTDTFAYCGAHLPRWHPISISGYHIREAGATAVQELAFTMANAIAYVEAACAAVLGGTQSLHTNAYDEALGLPTAEAATLALRTQQIIAAETGVTAVTDPLGGSPYVEALTAELERRAWALIERIDELGGAVAAIEQGFIQREIEESAYQTQRRIEDGTQVVVGVNKYRAAEAAPIETFAVDPTVQARQIDRERLDRERREATRVAACLEAVRAAARSADNLLPPMREALAAYASIGEICTVLRQEWGG